MIFDKLAIDIDEVISQSVPLLIKITKKLYKVSFKPKDMVDYSFEKYLEIPPGADAKIIKEFEKRLLELKVQPGIAELVNRLMLNYDVCFLTSRGNKEDTFKWLFKNKFDGMNEFGEYKSFFCGADGKGKICKREKIKYVIEDCGEKAVDCAKSGSTVFLIDRPWNKRFHQQNIIRCYSFEIAYNLLMKKFIF